MKKILITGVNSYVGNSFENWVKQWPTEYKVDKISVRDDSWKEKEFSRYDVILHVAGIAHVSTDPKMEELYYKVNRDLTIAKKAKLEGVKQFIFMSSIIIYGDSSHINEKRVITKDTIPTPSNFYGKSKLQAEEGVLPLQDENFNIVVIRPPMIYGKGSKGNYQLLSKIAKKSPVFPNLDNERSMIHIDNLCEFIRLIIRNEEKGMYFPQNEEYVKTSEMVKVIANINGRKIILTKVFNLLLKIMSNFTIVIDKAFGSLVYDKSMSEYKNKYIIRNFKDSIRVTEIKNIKRS